MHTANDRWRRRILIQLVWRQVLVVQERIAVRVVDIWRRRAHLRAALSVNSEKIKALRTVWTLILVGLVVLNYPPRFQNELYIFIWRFLAA